MFVVNLILYYNKIILSEVLCWYICIFDENDYECIFWMVFIIFRLIKLFLEERWRVVLKFKKILNFLSFILYRFFFI